MATNLVINSKSMAEVDGLDDRQEITVALMEQGFLASNAKAAVASTFIEGEPFDVNFRAALQAITAQRSSGRIQFSSRASGVSRGAKAESGASPLSANKVLSGVPLTTSASGADERQDRAHSPTQATRENPSAPRSPNPPAQPQPSTPARKESPNVEAIGKCGAPKHGISCDALLFANNKSGYCGRHFHLSKKKTSRPPKGAQPRASVPHDQDKHDGDSPDPKPTNGHAVSKGLSALWGSLNVEEKAQLLFPPKEEACRS